MNIIDAVKELIENPNAVAIVFSGRGSTYREVRYVDKRLVYPSGSVLMADSPSFILRQDFTIRYKYKERELTTKEIKERVASLLDELERRSSK